MQRSCGGVAVAPSSVRRRSTWNGLLGVLLVVWCGGGNMRPSCKAVEWGRIAGTAQTARNADGKLTVAVRAELQRRGGETTAVRISAPQWHGGAVEGAAARVTGGGCGMEKGRGSGGAK